MYEHITLNCRTQLTDCVALICLSDGFCFFFPFVLACADVTVSGVLLLAPLTLFFSSVRCSGPGNITDLAEHLGLGGALEEVKNSGLFHDLI